MPKNATAPKTTRGRAKVKNLPQAARELTAKEAKKVKGGIIIINSLPSEPYKPAGGVIQDITNPGAITGQKVK
jgi:hypothetical protein